jgi:hypothetical protein
LALRALFPPITFEGGSAALFLIVLTTVASFRRGGYIAGRLRSRWAATQAADEDEIEFRDGIHGLLVWAFGGSLRRLAGGSGSGCRGRDRGADCQRPNTTAGEPTAYDLYELRSM